MELSKLIFYKRLKSFLWNLFLLAIVILMLMEIMGVYSVSNKSIFNLSKLYPPLILTTSIYLFQQWRYVSKISKKYHKAVFKVFPKSKEYKDQQHYRKLFCHKNVIYYEIFEGGSKKEYTGEIHLGILGLKHGEGFHYNKTDMMFGFSNHIFKDKNTILVEHPYTTYKLTKEQLKKKPNYIPGNTNPGRRIEKASIWLRSNDFNK